MRVDGGHALGGCDHRVFVNRDAGVVLTARLRPGNLRFQLAINQLENTNRIGEVKKDIARVMTVLNDKNEKNA